MVIWQCLDLKVNLLQRFRRNPNAVRSHCIIHQNAQGSRILPITYSGTQASSDYAQGVVQDTVDEASVSTATSDWCAVLSC